MLKTFANAWKIADLRKKILYTLFIVLIFRIGSAIPVPFLDPSKIKEMIEAGGSLLGFIDVMSGGAFAKSTLFALNISPYITSSIVIQLLAVAIPYLENLAKEGPEGRKKLNQITRYTTVALAVLESFGYYALLRNQGAVNYTSGFEGIFAQAVIISSFIGGAMFVVWLGEQIDQKGIGNGISMILFAGIVSRVPSVVMSMFGYLKLAFAGGTNSIYFLTVPVIGVLFVIVIGFIVVMTNAERRIPVMYAKRVVGRKMYGGQSTF
ncbi:MAG: preprotein translocase subunit SecY, partial [Oscillospiraceae bacterium]